MEAMFSLYFRARLNRWCRRGATAADLCRRAVACGDHTKAYRMLAELELPGPHYLKVLGRVHRVLRPETYLEIGVARGDSLRLAGPETDVIGVDPSPRPRGHWGPRRRVFAQTSDQFFSSHDVKAEFEGKPIRMAFIDGMHRFEFALRDFANIEQHCGPQSVVFVHDCYPLDARSSAREQATVFWSGDVWRLVVLLKKYRPDLRLHVIGAPPTGLAMITGLNPRSCLIQDNLAELIAEGLAMDFGVIAGCRPAALNLVPNEWRRIRALLPG
jgi:methyltransferase family protein